MSLFAKRSTATTLEALKAEWNECKQCPFYTQRQQIVMGAGPIGAPVFVVGQAPGKEEDKTGIPFQGKGGDVTKAEFLKVGIPREHLFLTNVLICMPFTWSPSVRKAWADNCADRLEMELLIVKPKMIVALGAPAALRFLPPGSKGETRGRWFTYRSIPGVTVISPAALNRKEQIDGKWIAKKSVRETVDADMAMVKKLYQQVITGGH